MNNKVLVTLFCLALVSVGTSGCGQKDVLTDGPDTLFLTGTVSSFAREGRCWSITTVGGKVYELMNLPGAFKVEGIPVKAVVNLRVDMPSMCMLGPIAEVLQIAKGP
ncbi:MAG TPA: hypothetical protein VFV19_12705 [Candidatus Polarisedimenticolaceae bacterium]|nr:hypothetical protein [Candidatus Polarisedimenticolaceae bacterium]